jgi:hypothetical protein
MEAKSIFARPALFLFFLDESLRPAAGVLAIQKGDASIQLKPDGRPLKNCSTKP